jgi:hypothetical protein
MLRTVALRRWGARLRAIALRRWTRVRGTRMRAIALGWRTRWLVGIRGCRTRVCTAATVTLSGAMLLLTAGTVALVVTLLT